MKSNRVRAFTLIETLVVIATIAILFTLLLPFSRTTTRAPRADCTNRLKQTGIAFLTWAADNNDLFPMQFYTNKSGAMTFANSSNCFRYFQVMSNELNSPHLLICPSDSKRKQARGFGTSLSGTNISYFLGLDAREGCPTNILSGDRNITNGLALQNGILDVTTNRSAGWTTTQHNGGGNVLLSDGSVQQVTSTGFQKLIAGSGLVTNRLAMP